MADEWQEARMTTTVDGPVDAGAPAGSTAPGAAALRADFGAHLEAHYPRLVAQLYAITLDAGEAHDAVQDAYSRAWRQWARIGSSPDPADWIRRVAVRSTSRSWRRLRERLVTPRAIASGGDVRTAAVLGALRRLSPSERRCLVLAVLAGTPTADIAALEGVPHGTVQARLARGRIVVTEGLADVLPEVLGLSDEEYGGAYGPAYDDAAYDGAAYDAAYDGTPYDGAAYGDDYDGAYGAGDPDRPPDHRAAQPLGPAADGAHEGEQR
jgi:RNA polymerase sigma factor (sigma-70 family)